MSAKLLSFFLGEDKERPEIIEVRRLFFNQILYPFLIFGLLAVIMGILQVYQQGRWVFAFLYAGSFLIFAATMLPGPRIPLVIRSLALVLALFVVSVSILLRIGLSGIGLELLLLACTASSALLGKRAGLVLVGMGILAMIIVGGGMVSGVHPISEEHMLTSLSPLAWGTALVVFGMAGVGLVTIPQMFLARLKISLGLVKEHARKLERSNASLKETIKARERAETAARENERKYRLLAENATDVIWTMDMNLRFTYISPSLAEHTGYSVDETMAQALVNVLKPESYERVIALLGQRIRKIDDGDEEGWNPLIFEAEHFCKDGTTIFTSNNTRILKGPDGRPNLIVGVTHNITERKRAEDALKESEAQFRDIANSMADWIWEIDENGVYTYCSPNVQNILGYCLEEIIGKTPFDFMPKDEAEAKREGFRKLSLNRQPIKESGNWHINKDRELVCLVTNGIPIFDQHGEFRGYRGVDRDITEIKRAEQEAKVHQKQLMQADKMVALGTLVAGVAHEINNPNTFIASNAPMLEKIWKAVTPVLDQYQQEHGDFPIGNLTYSELRDTVPVLLGGIKEGSARVKKIVASLKNYARHDDSGFNDSLDLNQVVDTSLELLSNLLKKHTANLRVEKAAALPVQWGNKQQLEQLVINLIVNACQALPDRSKGVIISTCHDPENSMVRLTVRDEGVGIPEDILPRILDPFFTTKRDARGTGLGLSISANIVYDHGGAISFDSVPGRGTTAIVELPVRRADTTIRETD